MCVNFVADVAVVCAHIFFSLRASLLCNVFSQTQYFQFVCMYLCRYSCLLCCVTAGHRCLVFPEE